MSVVKVALLTILLANCFVFRVNAAKTCRRKLPIRYQIQRISTTADNVFESRSSSVILNDFSDAMNIRVQDDISALRNGMLRLDQKVRDLFLNGIRLKKIEPGVFDALKIEYHLHLDNNMLTVIRKGTFRNLPIFVLDLFSNRINNIEDGAIDGLKDLTTLNLYDNQLTTFTGKPIINSQRLFLLDLSFNRLTNLPDRQMFNFMLQDQPVHLLLENNQISEINRAAFGFLKGFRTLNLTNNGLTTLPSSLFTRYMLSDVFIANNSLTSLPNEFYTQNINNSSSILYLFDLRGNNFDCDTQGRLAGFRNVTGVTIMFDGNPSCINNRLDDTAFNYFNLTEFKR